MTTTNIITDLMDGAGGLTAERGLLIVLSNRGRHFYKLTGALGRFLAGEHTPDDYSGLDDETGDRRHDDLRRVLQTAAAVAHGMSVAAEGCGSEAQSSYYAGVAIALENVRWGFYQIGRAHV